MFSNTILQILAVLLALSLVLGLGLVAIFCTLLLLIAGMARLWDRWSLVRVSYERELSQQRAFPGDEIELLIRVANRKLLPLVSFGALDIIPADLQVLDQRLNRDLAGRQFIRRSTSMRWYESVIWRYRLRCTARGAYRFGPAELRSGDPFGFYESVREVDQRSSLIVYPRLLPLNELGLPPRHPLGDLRARQLIRDPLRTIGVRDYHPEDPLKDVHWSATARTGTLQTRVYEPTTANELAIFLDLDTFERYWEGIDPEQVERMISAAATLATAGLAEGYAVGLYVNGAPVEFEQLVRLPPSRSPAQLERIMETLARLTAYSIVPMARLLRLTTSDLPWGATLLLLSAIATEETRAALLQQRERGRNVAWLYLGSDAPPKVPGVLVRHAPQPGDWRRKDESKWARPKATEQKKGG